jgi:predicted amidohydrolase
MAIEVVLGAANVQIAHDKAKNLRRFLELIDEAAAQRVDVLVLPEMGLQGYADFAFPQGSKDRSDQKQYYFREADPIPGPSTEAIRRAAERHGMYVQLGMAESALHGNAIFNSIALIAPEGVIGVYRKMHNQFEFPYFDPGEDSPTFDTVHGRFGAIICYDLCFPELIRTYALKGADAVLMSTAWPMKGHDRSDDYHGWSMDLAAQANAFFNQMWMVVSNHCEKNAYSQGLDYYGGSQIIDPHGKVVEYLAHDEGLVVHAADLRETTLKSRTEGFFGLNLLQDRRPEHYAALVDESYRHPALALDSDLCSIAESGRAGNGAKIAARAGLKEPISPVGRS